MTVIKSGISMILALAAFTSAAVAQVQGNLENDEPAYCNPAKFGRYEMTTPQSSRAIERLHAYRLGNVVLVGMAIGHSSTTLEKELALNYAPAVDQDNYCTWFVGDKNPSAQQSFNYHRIEFFSLISGPTASYVFMKAIGPSFTTEETHNFIECAVNHNYIAVGCDGQKHRGPSVFAMVLAFSGCSADHATEIANNIWGLNGVAPWVRHAIVQAAYDFGTTHPDERAAIAQQFGAGSDSAE